MTRRALCIGINRFTDAELPPLRGAVNDARTLSLMLQRDFGFDARDVRVLVDAQATKAQVLAALDALIDGARAGDDLVLFASTHGSHVPDQDGDDDDGYDEVLVTHDHDWARAVLVDDELTRALARAPRGVRLCAIWDTCHAGTLQDTAPAGRRARGLTRGDGVAEGVELLGVRYAPLPERYDRPRASKAAAPRSPRKRRPAAGARHGALGAVVRDDLPAVSLSGCADDETSADASFGGIHEGAFTHAMLDVLRRTREDLTWGELHARARALMTRLGIRQTPQLHLPTAMVDVPVFGGRARRTPSPSPSPPAQARAADDLAAVQREIVAHEQAGRWPEAVAACWRRVALAGDPAEKVRTIEHIVSIYRVVLRDEPSALRAAREVLRVDPAHPGALAYLRTAGEPR